MDMNLELEKMLSNILIRSRRFSDFGPDFKDLETLRDWAYELKNFPPAILQRGMEKLKGNKNFPTLNEIKAVCRQDMAPSNQPLSKSSDREIMSQLLKTPIMQELKKANIGFFYKAQDDICRIAKVGSPKVNMQYLRDCLENPGKAIADVLPQDEGFRLREQK